MTFDARQEAKQATEEYAPFPFTGLDGKSYTLPHPLTLTTRQTEVLMRAEKDSDDAAMLALFEALAPEALEAIRDMPQIVTAKLFDAWRAGLGDLGKSGSVPSRPNRAARRSKRTSNSVGSRSTA
jgi:hypothetical protein